MNAEAIFQLDYLLVLTMRYCRLDLDLMLEQRKKELNTHYGLRIWDILSLFGRRRNLQLGYALFLLMSMKRG